MSAHLESAARTLEHILAEINPEHDWVVTAMKTTVPACIARPPVPWVPAIPPSPITPTIGMLASIRLWS